MTYTAWDFTHTMAMKSRLSLADRNSRMNMTLSVSDFEMINREYLENETVVGADKTSVNESDSTCALERLDCTCARGPLTREELHACENVLSRSKNSLLFLLPNHHIDNTGLFRGFKFECHAEERATVMPIGKEMFDLIAMYECKMPKSSHSDPLRVHPHAMRILNERESFEKLMKDYLQTFDTFDSGLHGSYKTKTASFDCIRDEISSTKFTQQVPDKRMWSPTKPARVGLYHAYVRTHKKDAIEHKIFIVVSGCLKIACEELENLWQDIHDNVSCKNFVESEECHWLRIATMRNHNRIAYEVAKILNLQVETRLDLDDPSKKQYMALGTTYSFKNDMYVTDNDRIQIVDMGCFLNRSQNGVLFEMHENEGYWLFTGPKDYASSCIYGIVSERNKHMNCFPTQTLAFNGNYTVQSYSNVVKVMKANSKPSGVIVNSTTNIHESCTTLYHGNARFYLFPNEEFMKMLQYLGHDRNDSVLHLMPIMTFETLADE